MKIYSRRGGHTGYHLPGSFRGLLTHTWSTRQMLTVTAVVAAGVLLLMWILSQAGGTM